jgi:hypothetical protein
MARYRRSDQIESRVADELDVDGVVFTVDLIAKKATGVDGYRLTLSCLQVDGPESRFVQLEPADSREEAEDRAEALAGDPDRLRDLLRTAGD